ncbi:MAG: hypothetical protein RLZZ562_94 [Planctomycetota bacterium]|jgi:RNA recognition motif-containing protein
MQKRLFVGNLSFDTTETSLRSHFEDGGRKVSTCQLMVDRDTGRSRGFAFVEMESEQDAAGAIKSLDGTQFEGRAIKVNEAMARNARGNGAGQR